MLPALYESVGIFNGKSATKHVYSQPDWEIIEFNNSLDSALFGAPSVYFYSLFP